MTPPVGAGGLAPLSRFRRGERLSRMSTRKPKPFRATKEVKRQARLRVGSPPPAQLHASRKRKSPKHKKRAWEQTLESP
jgi:hypothetical protein